MESGDGPIGMGIGDGRWSLDSMSNSCWTLERWRDGDGWGWIMEMDHGDGADADGQKNHGLTLMDSWWRRDCVSSRSAGSRSLIVGYPVLYTYWQIVLEEGGEWCGVVVWSSRLAIGGRERFETSSAFCNRYLTRNLSPSDDVARVANRLSASPHPLAILRFNRISV